jgi:proteasome lid subunit RPN8/RPN11
MFYVSIWKPVMDRIVQAARDTETEIIGLLLGRLKDDTIIIQDSTTGEFSSEPHGATLPARSIAIIADELLSGRLKGNIVGWYHSHTEGGLFFSETDIATQKNLQQFSSLITGLVVDSTTGEVGYFRVTPGTNRAVRIADEDIVVYTDPNDAVPIRPKTAPIVPPTPTVEVRRRSPGERALTRRVAASIALLVLIVSVGAVAAFIYQELPHTTQVTINHQPISVATIGTAIEVSANVTGPAHNVTLIYGLENTGPITAVTMNLIPGGKYGYVIPGNQVTGNMAYYIKASDAAGTQVNTTTYHIAVADFNLLSQPGSLTVYRSKSASAEVQLLSVNNFNHQLQLSANGNPNGLIMIFSRNTASSGSVVGLNVTADPTTANGTYPISLVATYLPPQSSPVMRQATLDVTVADFQVQVIRASTVVQAGSTTTFTLTLTLQKGFVDPVKVTLVGLPQGATYTITTSNATVLAGGPGTTAMTLQVKIPAFAKAGSYQITIEAVGGGVVHSLTVQLIVR